MSNVETDARANGRHTRDGRQQRAVSRARKPRSAITSGRQLFVQGNPNSAWSRRFHDLVIDHVNDAGGFDLLSEAQLSLIKRCASIECELERLDAMLSAGKTIDLDLYGRASSHLRRLFETIGVERKSRDVTPPTLDQYLADQEAVDADVV